MEQANTTSTNPVLLVAAWAIVTLPTAWGLSYTIQNAMKIFTAPPATSSAPAPAASAPNSDARRTAH